MVAPNGAAAISRGVYPVDQIIPHRKKPQRGAGEGSDKPVSSIIIVASLVPSFVEFLPASQAVLDKAQNKARYKE